MTDPQIEAALAELEETRRGLMVEAATMADRMIALEAFIADANPRIYAIDWGIEGGDKTVEVEMERLPDGTMMVKSFGEVVEVTCREIKT